MKYLIRLLIISGFIFGFWQPKATLADAFVVNLAFDQSTRTLSLDNKGVTYAKDMPTPLAKLMTPSTTGTDKIIFLQGNGEQAFAWQFDPQNGSFSIDLPYFSTAKSLKIIDVATNKTIIQADLSNLSTCNSNGLCEFDKGENVYTCVADCASGNVKYDQQTLTLLKGNNGVIKDAATDQILLDQTNQSAPPAKNNYFITIIIAGAIILIGGITFMLLKRKK
jgi:hypothetical protein